MAVATETARLVINLFGKYGNLVIVMLGLPVAYYQPIGPDAFIILMGLSGGDAFWSACLAVVFTLVGTLAGFIPARRYGRRLLKKVFRRRIRVVDRFERTFARYGGWFVLASAFGPVPLRYATWIAGLSGMSLARFVLLVLAGLLPRFIGEAALVTLYGDWVRGLLGRWFPEVMPGI